VCSPGRALWRGRGGETPYSYYYYPFNKGYSTNWKIPPYDPAQARKVLAEAGHGGGFEVRVNPYVQLVAQDGPDVMEAVALDWEKVGIKVKRAPEAASSFGPKGRLRKTNKTCSVYGYPPYDEPVAGWERVIHAKGAFNLLLDGVYDEEIDAVMRELDSAKRAAMTRDLGQKLYDGYHGVMLGMKSITWAVSRKVHEWPTLAYVPAKANYEHVS
jgi:ABC-type transport system substrate-binding protein